MQSLLRTAVHSVRVGATNRVRCMASAAPVPPPSKYFVLEYKYVPDILEKRTPYRAAHLAAAKQQAEEGKIVLAGAVGETPEGALFIWKDVSKESIEAFVAEDPYIKAGLVPSWSIKPYTVVAQSS